MLISLLVVLAGSLIWSGCESSPPAGAQINPPKPFFSSLSDTNGSRPSFERVGVIPKLQVGEMISVSFHDLPAPGLETSEQRIAEDGTITLPYNRKVLAMDKTPVQLQEDVRKAYVPSLYLRMTVIVKAEERAFYVGGEVKLAGRQRYMDKITVLRAIQTAGDFTDFANRSKIQLIRANGESYIIDWDKAKKDSKFDLEVFPGDQIIVPKGIF
jgi:protein involved in polysaccharide export with SLBB domain